MDNLIGQRVKDLILKSHECTVMAIDGEKVLLKSCDNVPRFMGGAYYQFNLDNGDDPKTYCSRHISEIELL